MLTFALHHWALMLSLLGGTGGLGAFAWFLPGPALAIMKAVLTFVRTHSIWLTVSIALVVAGGLDHVITHRELAKTQSQLSKCAAAQKALQAQSKAKRQEITKTVDHYIKVTVPEVKTVVQKIESAPLKGGCQTPDAVREADV